MDFIRTRTAKLRSLGKRLLTRRARASNSIAPTPEEVEPRQTSSSSRQASSRLRQTSSRLRQTSSRLRQASSRLRRLTRRARASNRIAPASEKVEQSQASPRQRSSSPRTKTLKREQAIADISIRNRSKTAARKLQRSVRRAIKREEECNICLRPMLYPKTLICGHKFHRKCIDKWTATNPSCPNCRAYIAPETRLSMPISGNNTANTIGIANELIVRMINAETFDQARGLYDDITRIINSLPRNDDYRRVSNLQWNAWLHVHRRVALTIPIPRRGRVLTGY